PRDLASLPKSIAQKPVFEWTPVKGASRYLLQLSTVKDFTHLLSEEMVNTPRLEWRGVTPGRIFWRVRSLGPSGEQGAFSKPGQLQVMLPSPQLDSIYKFVVPEGNGDKITLEWSGVPLVNRYLVQVGPTRDLADAEERLVKSPKVLMRGTPAQYY